MVGYAYDVIRVTAMGTSFSATEEWSTGFFIGQQNNDAGALTQDVVDQIAPYWETFFEAANSHIKSVWTTTQIKCNFFPAGSATANPDLTVFHTYTSPPVGGEAGSPTLPPQISVVGSLLGNPEKGLGAKGRMFLPGCHLGLNTDAQISVTERGQLATTLAAMFSAINADTDIPGLVINASKGRSTGVTAPPINKEIVKVKIGSVYDTQRRRRNQLNEVYSSVAVTGA